MTQTIEQLTARVRELEEENARLKAECDDIKQVQFPRKLEAVAAGWKKQLAKANQLWQVAKGRCDGLEEKLAKAEQRVAEACALAIYSECNSYSEVSQAIIRSGEWRKFVKEV